jgi:uncharacterized membrane protein HdeD (DUF308 family)
MAAQTSTSAKNEQIAVFGAVSTNWRWFLYLGILFIILGIIALGRLFAFTLADDSFFGILIILGGVAQFGEALKCSGWKGLAFHVLIAVLYVFGGIFILRDPLAASVFLTWILGLVFIGVGIVRAFMAYQIRKTESWFVPMVGGVISIILGGLILAKWPLSGLFAIGLFIAIELIINGWSYLSIAFQARKARKAIIA